MNEISFVADFPRDVPRAPVDYIAAGLLSAMLSRAVSVCYSLRLRLRADREPRYFATLWDWIMERSMDGALRTAHQITAAIIDASEVL